MRFSGVSLYLGVEGGQSLMMAKPLLGEELARRCEQSEHGERQLKSTEHFSKLSMRAKVKKSVEFFVRCQSELKQSPMNIYLNCHVTESQKLRRSF